MGKYTGTFGKALENVRKNAPLIHNITNYVTVNDCANILLACGASPIMADDVGEVEEITALCAGLNINIGTLNSSSVKAMLLAGKKACELGHTAVLDPVGAGASSMRTGTALTLMNEVRFAVIRGNVSEIKTLAGKSVASRGVDTGLADRVTDENLDEAVSFVKKLSAATGAVISMTGAIDIVADDREAFCIRGGRPEMSRVTGTGCMLSAMTAAFVTANPDMKTAAAAAAAAAMGIAGETAYERLGELDGNSSYRNYIIDAVYRMTPEQLENGAKYEVR